MDLFNSLFLQLRNSEVFKTTNYCFHKVVAYQKSIQSGYKVTSEQLLCPGVPAAQCHSCCLHKAPQGAGCSEHTGAVMAKHWPVLQVTEKHTHIGRCFSHCHCPSPVHHKLQHAVSWKRILYWKVCRATWINVILAYLQTAWEKNSCLEKSYCNTSNNYSLLPYRGSPSPFLRDINYSLLTPVCYRQVKMNMVFPKNWRLSFTQLI